MIEQNLTKKSFKLEGIIATADFLGREISFHTEKNYGIRVVIPKGYSNPLKSIVQQARKAVGHWGIANISDITSQVEEEYASHINTNYNISLLTNLKDFQWLDETGGWFWLTSVTRNRLINQITKILSVTDSIEISELRSGISRYSRMEGFAPPRRVLLEICRQLPWCRVEGNVVAADPPLDWEEILAEGEWSICWILKEYGPVLTRQMLEDLCVELGIKQSTFSLVLSTSPIVTKYAPGIYSLRGAKIPPGVVESIISRQKAKARKVFIDNGWNAEGKIWFAYRLNKGMINSGLFYVPASMGEFLQGEFNLKAADNAPIGSVTIKSTRGWNLQRFFHRRGGEPEDYLVLVFDLNLREVKAYMGNLDLLDDFQSNN
jgi:hypothetical protein